MGDFSYDRSTFLFAMPRFAVGVGRLIDFGATLTEYNQSFSPAEADAIAIAQDWHAVGDDLRDAEEHVVPDDVRSSVHGLDSRTSV